MLFGSSKVLLLEEDFINFIVKVRDTVRGLRGVESMDHKVCVCLFYCILKSPINNWHV